VEPPVRPGDGNAVVWFSTRHVWSMSWSLGISWLWASEGGGRVRPNSGWMDCPHSGERGEHLLHRDPPRYGQQRHLVCHFGTNNATVKWRKVFATLRRARRTPAAACELGTARPSCSSTRSIISPRR